MRIDRAEMRGRVLSAALAAALVPMVASLYGLMLPIAASAQNLGQRTVMGTVLSADSTPAAGATVFLKDVKTKSIRSYTADADGHYRFTQSYMADDYQLWAEKGGKKSAVKEVSSWDARKEFVAELRLK